MRFDPAKAWPHPVLRPRSCGDDYPSAEFEVEIEVKRIRGSTAIEVDTEFALSDPTLQELVERGGAQYMLLVKASKTHCRRLLRSTASRFTVSFSAGELSGRVEFLPFLCCTCDLAAFRADGWHEALAGRTFDIPSGAVLAQDIPHEYWIDTADEMPLSSIFGLKSSSRVTNGLWKCQLEDDRVWIVMSEPDKARYEVARSLVNGKQEAQYLMNALYLPAIMWVLTEVDKDHGEYGHCRWFSSLDHRLEAVGCKPLGAEAVDRLVDAQKILELPFPKMPVIADQEERA